MRKPWLSFALLAAALLLASPALHAQSVTGSKVGYPDQCVNDPTNPTSAEWLTCTQKRAGTTKTNPLYVEPAAGLMPVGNYVWDGAAWQKWRAYLLNQDNLAVTSLGAATGSFLLGYDTVGNNWDRLRLAPLNASLAATNTGLQTLAANYFYDGTTYQRWTGTLAGADNVSNTTAAPWTRTFPMIYDGATWDRLRLTTLGDTMGATPAGIGVASYTTFYDGINYQRWFGGTGANGVGDTTAFPYTHSYLHTYHGATWDRLTSTTVSDAISATPQGIDSNAFNLFYDGTNFRRWLGGSLTSSISAPVTGPYVGSIMYGYSATGPFYYPVKADANGIFVHQADLLPGEDSTNDWRRVRLQSVATYAPTKTTTATVTAAETEVLASVEVLGYAGYTINVKNTGGVNSLDTTYLYVSPDGTNWVLLDTNVANIAPGITARVFAFSNSTDRYVKVMAAATAAVTTSADCWITARVAN
jgi:hypothetical protein